MLLACCCKTISEGTQEKQHTLYSLRIISVKTVSNKSSPGTFCLDSSFVIWYTVLTLSIGTNRPEQTM